MGQMLIPVMTGAGQLSILKLQRVSQRAELDTLRKYLDIVTKENKWSRFKMSLLLLVPDQ